MIVCSHHIPYDMKCPDCIREALQREYTRRKCKNCSNILPRNEPLCPDCGTEQPNALSEPDQHP